MFLYHLHAWYPQRPVKLWDPVEPKLQTFMSYYVSTGNWTQVLWKRSLCLECVSHHFNPSELFKYHVLLLSFYLLLLGKKHCLILFQRLSVYCFSWSFFPPVSVRRLHYLLDTVVLFLYLLFSLAEIGLHVWNIFFFYLPCVWGFNEESFLPLRPTMKAIILTFTMTVVLCCICTFIIGKKNNHTNWQHCWPFYSFTKCLTLLAILQPYKMTTAVNRDRVCF